MLNISLLITPLFTITMQLDAKEVTTRLQNNLNNLPHYFMLLKS